MGSDTLSKGSARLLFLRRIRVAISIAIFAACAYYVASHIDEFGRISALGWKDLSLLSGLTVLNRIAWMGLSLMVALSIFGLRLSLAEAFSLAGVTAIANYLPLKAGIGGQIVYLNRRHRLPVHDCICSAFASSLLQVFAACLTALLALLFLDVVRSTRAGLVLTAGFVGLALLCLMLVAFRPSERITGWLGKIQFLSLFFGAWDRFRSARPKLLLLLLIQMILNLAIAWKIQIAAAVVGFEIGIWEALLLISSANLLNVVAIVPGNLGIREAAIGIVAIAIGLPADLLVVAATIDRAVVMGIVFLFGGYCSYRVLFRYAEVSTPVSAGSRSALSSQPR